MSEVEINGKRVGCWYCDGDLEHHPDEAQIVADWEEYDAEDWEDVVVGVLRCKECGADILVTRCRDTGPKDETKEDAPYDRNRCPEYGGYAIWQSDFNYDEVYGEGSGIVSYLTCDRCGAELEYSIKEEDEHEG